MPNPTIIIGLNNLKEFDHNINDFKIFIERLNQFFIVNEISGEEKQRAYLLSLLSEETYKLLVSLCVPHTPESQTFRNLKETLNKHLTPIRSIFGEAYQQLQLTEDSSK